MRRSYLSGSSYVVRSVYDLPGYEDESKLTREQRLQRAFPIKGETLIPLSAMAAETAPQETVADFAKRIGEQMRKRREQQLVSGPTYRKRRGGFQRGVWSQNGNA